MKQERKKNNFRNCMERNQRKISEVTNNMLFLSKFHILLRLVRIWSSILFPSVDIIPKSSATASNDCIFTWHNLLISISRYLNLLNFSYFSNMLFFFQLGLIHLARYMSFQHNFSQLYLVDVITFSLQTECWISKWL